MQQPSYNSGDHDQTRDHIKDVADAHSEHLTETAALRLQLEAMRHELAEARVERDTAQTRLRTVLDTLPVAVFIADKTGEIVETNAAARDLWAQTPLVASATDYDVYKAWRTDTGQKLAADEWSLARTLSDGATVLNEELVIETFNGARKTIIHSSAPIRDEAGGVVGGVVTELDISDRKRAEGAVRSSETRYRMLAEAVPQIVWATDGRGRAEYFNQRWYAYTGQTVAQSLVSGTTDAMQPDDYARTTPVWEEALRTGQPYEVEYRLRGQDGRYRWFLCRGVPVRNEGGVVTAWFGTSTDIDNQKRMEVAQSVVGEASAILAGSGDITAALGQIVRLPVPRFGHWCNLDLYDQDGAPVRFVAYADPATPDGVRVEQSDLSQNAERLDYPQTTLLDTIPPALVADSTSGSEGLRDLGDVSVLVVPIHQHEQLLGAITLIGIGRDEEFSNYYQSAIEGVARRVGTAIENARLTQAMTAALRLRDTALIEAELQRRYFYDLLMTAPAYVLIFRGADHVIEFANAYEQRLLGNRALLGSRLADIFQDMGDTPIRRLVALLDRVRETRVPVMLNDIEVRAAWADAPLDTPRYFDFSYEPIIAADGTVDSILSFSVEVTQRVRARQQVEQQRTNFYNLLMDAPTFSYVLRGPDHVYEFVSKKGWQILGQRDLIGKSLIEAIPELHDQPYIGLLDHIYRTGEPFSGQEQLAYVDRALNGLLTEGYFNIDYQPIRDGSGAVTGIFVNAIEVTEQVRARQQAEQQRHYLYSLLMDAPVQIYVIREAELIVEFVNAKAQEIFAGRALVGKKLHETMPELAEQGFFIIMERVRTTGEPFVGTEIPIWIDRKLNGVLEEGYFNFTYQPIREADSSISGILCVATEVTEQVQARQRVEELAAQLNAIIAAMPDGVYVSDPEGQLMIVNTKGSELLGISQEYSYGTVGETAAMLRLTADEDTLVAADDVPLARALRGETGTNHFMALKKVDTGEKIYLRSSYAPIRAADGTLTGAVAVSSDITTMRELEQQKDAFLSIAAHELKTPITAIKGLVQMASRRLERAGQSREVETLTNVDKQINRMTALINELTDVSRIQTGKFEMMPTRFNYAAQARRVAEAMQATTTQHNVRVNAPDMVEIVADPDRIEQVLTNLIGNAIKYSPEGGTVTITLEQDGAEVALRVHDEGIGIPIADRPRLFERFHRASNAKEYRVGGFGLGLYISAQIVQAHDGRIWLCDTETDARGTTFCVTLPAV